MLGRWRAEENIEIHHETIYRYIYEDKAKGRKLHTHLRHYGKRYRKRNPNLGRHIGVPDRVDIDERPEVVNNRECLGDWEADTIIGKNHKGKDEIIDLLTPLQGWVQTITFDNGREFTEHMKASSSLACQTYFAKPYHSWERGQNENVL